MHPVVRVRSNDSVLGVFSRLRASGGRKVHGRKRTPGRALLAGAILLGTASLGVIAGNTTAATAADDTTFTVGLPNEVDSFNPFLGIEAPSYEMWALTYDQLITYNMETMAAEPGLAAEWETSADGLTWTFTLRDDVLWSDGEQLTSADVKHTLDRIIDGGPEAASWGAYVKGVTTVDAPDDTTVVLNLKNPIATLPLLPMPIVPEHIWKDVAQKDVKNYSAEPEDGPVVGSGPFRLVEGEAGGSLYRFEKNPDYWGGEPYVDEVIFRVYKAADPMIQALIAGEVDLVRDITALQVKELESREGITAANGLSPGFDQIAFNTGAVDLDTGDPMGDGHPALKDQKFRWALGYALDLTEIKDKVYYGAGIEGDSIVPPSFPTFRWEPPEDERLTFDLDKAGQLLDEAGYTLGDDGKRTMPDGSDFGTLRLFARADSETSLKVMTFFSEWLGDIGIDSKVETMEEGKLTNIILEGNYDAFEWGWYVDPDPSSMLSYFTCGQLGNWSDSWYCKDEYDAMYDQQNAEVDREARIETINAMQEMLYFDAPYLVTSYNTTGEAFRSDRFACLRPQPDPGGVWTFQFGVYNYINMRPVDEADDCGGAEGVTEASESSGEDDSGSGVLIGIVVGVVVIAGIGGVIAMRRRGATEDRE